MISKKFEDYLNSAYLNERLSLFSPNKTFEFHWADWDMTTFYLQEQYNKNSEPILQYVNHVKKKLNQKTLINVNGHIETITYYALYNEYYHNKNNSWFLKPEHSNTKIKHNDRAFYVKDLKWFEDELYKSYIYINLLEHKEKNFIVRDFRLNTKLPLSNNIFITQISKFGLLLEIPHSQMQDLLDKDSISLMIPELNWQFAKKLRFFQLQEIMSKLEWNDFGTKEHTLNPKKLKHMFGNNKDINIIKDKHYWVVPYKEFSNHHKIEETFATIINVTENYLISEFESILISKNDKVG